MRRRMLALFMVLTLLTELLLGGGVYLFVRELLIERASARMEEVGKLSRSERMPRSLPAKFPA